MASLHFTKVDIVCGVINELLRFSPDDSFCVLGDPAVVWDVELGHLDLVEQLLWVGIIEGEASIEHCVEHHAQGPHVRGLSHVGLAAQHIR